MDLDAQYQTGVFWQDVQHSQLIHLVEKISSAGLKDFDPAMFSYTVGFIVMYANQHFNLEEEYMDRYEYPDRVFHKKLHGEFIQELKVFRSEHPVYSKTAAERLTKDMDRWIQEHILMNDQKLGRFLMEKERENLLKKR